MRFIPLPQKTLNALQKNDSRMLQDISTRGKVELKLEKDGVEIEGDGGNEWVAEQVIKALGFGFLAKQAYKLFSDDYFLDVLSLHDAFRGNEKKIIRYKARVIGVHGTAKKKLQDLSGAYLSITSEQIAILGEFEDIKSAKEAVLRLLEGCEHNGVYAYLEKENHRKKRFM
ncbi:hypothetical protein HY994_03495 [Candidatus Micrarchaeota archaeon]|nr:hypothetical protein [Candidatus Micrarchaeota archaeon]